MSIITFILEECKMLVTWRPSAFMSYFNPASNGKKAMTLLNKESVGQDWGAFAFKEAFLQGIKNKGQGPAVAHTNGDLCLKKNPFWGPLARPGKQQIIRSRMCIACWIIILSKYFRAYRSQIGPKAPWRECKQILISKKRNVSKVINFRISRIAWGAKGLGERGHAFLPSW